MDLLIVAGNARSLIANRGDLVRDLLARGLVISAAVPEHDFLPEVKRLGVEVFTFDLGRTGINPWDDLKSIVSLMRLMRKLKPRAVFSYTVKPVVYGSLSAYLTGVPRVYSMITGLGHAYTTETWRTRLLRSVVSRLYCAGLACSHKVFFQNPDDLQDFVDLGIVRDLKKVVLINGSGVDVEYFSVQPLPKEAPVFLFVGRLLTEKGIAEFVEAAQQLHQRWPKARFLAVGPHDHSLPHSVTTEALRDWKRAGVVEFIGGVKDVRPWLAASSVFVLPSYREGTPRSVLEAMSVGRAIVTTDAPGCRETVVEGENGFLVAPGSVQPLVEAMEMFLKKPELISRMAQVSRRIAVEKYEVSKVNMVILKAMDLA